jgi:flavin-dependent dehydrogenase
MRPTTGAIVRSAQLRLSHARASTENIYVHEKSGGLGAHQLSGATMDPLALRESASLDSPVTRDRAYLLTSRRAWKFSIVPLRNHGNTINGLFY